MAITKSKNGNVIGRSIVGNVVAGSAGAIIGVLLRKNIQNTYKKMTRDS